MADVDYHDDIEANLNREVDQAMGRIDFEEPDLPQYDLTPEEIAGLISRIANEIQQVVALIRPKPAVLTQPSELPRVEPQDPDCVKAAKDLLLTQVAALQKLAAQLE